MYVLSAITAPLYTKKVLESSDFVGNYVIDRSYFPGSDAQWQYETFKFTITETDSLYLYVHRSDATLDIYKHQINYKDNYTSTRLEIDLHNNGLPHHVVSGQPAIYRDVWDFVVILNSPLYNNMYFRKMP